MINNPTMKAEHRLDNMMRDMKGTCVTCEWHQTGRDYCAHIELKDGREFECIGATADELYASVAAKLGIT